MVKELLLFNLYFFYNLWLEKILSKRIHITVPPKSVREAPGQMKLKEEIEKLKSQLKKLRSVENCGIPGVNCETELVKINQDLDKKEKKLKRLSLQTTYQRGHRLKNRNIVKKLSQNRFVFTKKFSMILSHDDSN